MGEWAGVIAAVVAGLIALAAARSDPRVDRAFAVKTIGLLLLYLAYAVAGVLLVFAVLPPGPAGETRAAIGTLFMLAWIGFGMVWLIRLVPRLREPPALLARPFGPVGVGCIVIAAAAFAALVWIS